MKIKIILLALIFLVLFAYCKKPEPVLIPVGDAKVIGKTEDGNFIVTPAFIKLTYDLAYKVKKLELELQKCREEKGRAE